MHRLHRHLVCFALVLACASPSAAEEQQSAVVHAFSAPALLGMQLSAQRGFRRGLLGEKEIGCVMALKQSEFYPVVSRLVDANLASAEQATANEFFQSAVGRKYAKHGLLQLYPAVGERAPEPLPDISDAEYRRIEDFSRTAAGRKIFNERFMQRVVARQALDERIQELLAQCRAQ